MKKYQIFLSENFQFLEVKFSIYLNRRVFVMLMYPVPLRLTETWPRGYKTFFMLNAAEHEIFSANKYENANNSWHFHIY